MSQKVLVEVMICSAFTVVLRKGLGVLFNIWSVGTYSSFQYIVAAQLYVVNNHSVFFNGDVEKLSIGSFQFYHQTTSK